MTLMKTASLFIVTALAEITGCYLSLLWLTNRARLWVLLPAAGSLVIFVWLLSLQPTASGRVYAGYGGVYIATAILWLWLVDGVRPTTQDLVGSALALCGMTIIMSAPRT